jgi:hypothetical protein
MDELVQALKRDFPTLKFQASTTFCWSPSDKLVLYTSQTRQPRGGWSLLHEVSHGLLEHLDYQSDFELLKLEVAAWHKAAELAPTYGLKISDAHIQKCLNTYRDWLHQRSTCPACGSKSLQSDREHYRCFNCQATWKVTASRFCRPYRLSRGSEAKEKPLALKTQTAFL